jgi:hypothetical protein
VADAGGVVGAGVADAGGVVGAGVEVAGAGRVVDGGGVVFGGCVVGGAGVVFGGAVGVGRDVMPLGPDDARGPAGALQAVSAAAVAATRKKTARRPCRLDQLSDTRSIELSLFCLRVPT